MAHYLVTGGAGFIGSHLVEELLCRGQRVRVLDNFSTGKRENIEPLADRIELFEGDIRSYHIVREAVDGVDYVLHQGALPSVPRSINDPITTNEVNVTGTLNVVEAAVRAGAVGRGQVWIEPGALTARDFEAVVQPELISVAVTELEPNAGAVALAEFVSFALAVV